MTDLPSQLQRDVARHIVTKILKVRPGENAVIESWDHTLPIASAMVDEVRRAGGRTLHVQEDEDAWWRAIDRKQSKLLGKSSTAEWAAQQAADIYVHFWGPGNTDRIEQLPEKTFDQAVGWIGPWYDSARKAGLRGCRVTIGFATDGRARQWGVDRAEWQDAILHASLIDPAELARRGARLARLLSRCRKVRITHPNGTDLEVGLAGKPARIHDGRPHPKDKNFGPSDMLSQIPAGRVDVALDSKTAEGTIHANRRTNIWWYWSSGGTFEFAKGKLTSFSFENGEKDFSKWYRQGTAGKDRTGSLMFGLNPLVDDVPNLESVESGAVTLVIGRNGHLKGSNKSNFMNWVTLAGSDVTVDGTPILRGGKLA